MSIPPEKYKPASLDKMITLIASLVEKSRDSNMKLQLTERDYNAVAGGKVNIAIVIFTLLSGSFLKAVFFSQISNFNFCLFWNCCWFC